MDTMEKQNGKQVERPDDMPDYDSALAKRDKAAYDEGFADGVEYVSRTELPSPSDEHPRADCEGCRNAGCPCQMHEDFLGWWQSNFMRMVASDSFTHPIDYAAAGWEAASGGHTATPVRTVEDKLPPAWPHEIPADREWAKVRASGEGSNLRFLEGVLVELHIRERQLLAALTEVKNLRSEVSQLTTIGGEQADLIASLTAVVRGYRTSKKGHFFCYLYNSRDDERCSICKDADAALAPKVEEMEKL